MLKLTAQIREKLGKKVKSLRKEGLLPAVLYGPKIKNVSLEVNQKDFEKTYQEAGESSLISLSVAKNNYLVLIHDVKLDPLTDKPIHVDFYQPKLDEEIEAHIPLVFEGEAPAVKEFGGTFVKNIYEITVKALPQHLPHEIKVNVEKLKTFEDNILIKELEIPKDVKIINNPDEIIALVTPPEKVEEELEKPIEEKVEEVEKVEEKKEEAVAEGETVEGGAVEEEKK